MCGGGGAGSCCVGAEPVPPPAATAPLGPSLRYRTCTSHLHFTPCTLSKSLAPAPTPLAAPPPPQAGERAGAPAWHQPPATVKGGPCCSALSRRRWKVRGAGCGWRDRFRDLQRVDGALLAIGIDLIQLAACLNRTHHWIGRQRGVRCQHPRRMWACSIAGQAGPEHVRKPVKGAC